jgi:hypothetical protein
MDGARGPTVPGPPLLLQFCFGRVFIPQSLPSFFTSFFFVPTEKKIVYRGRSSKFKLSFCLLLLSQCLID